MKIQIKYVPEFTVVGKLGQGASTEGPKWILPLWKKTNENFVEIKDIVIKAENGAPKGMWGIMGNPTKFLGRWDEQGLYLACCEAEKDCAVPQDWTKWTVPAQTYLTVDCTQTAYGENFDKVIKEYLPKHGLQMIGAAHEYYPEPGNPEHVELYFPIAQDYLFCQSCGMPMTENEHLGTEKDGESNYDYCCYCYKDGAFTKEQTMDEMIELCLDFGKDMGLYTDRAKAKKEMQEWFPTLKRWKKL